MFILAALGGPLLLLTGMGIHEAGRQYTASGMPLYPLVLGIIIFWLAAGIPAQIRIFRDRQWSLFLSHMPVSPVHRMAVHVSAGILINLVIAVLLFCLIWGAGITWWTPATGIRHLVLGVAVAWVISIQIGIALFASCFRKTPVIIGVLLILSGLLLSGRIAWFLGGTETDIQRLYHIFETDPLLLVSSIAGLAHTLTATEEQLIHSAVICLAHQIILITLVTTICLYVIGKVLITNLGHSVPLLLTRWLRKSAFRLIPGPRGGQILTEWFRTWRANSAKITLYALGGVVLGLIFRIKLQDANSGLFILAFAAMTMASDGAVEILEYRRGNKLYDLYGVDPSDYLYGFITSIGLLISFLLLAQIPVFCDKSVTGSTVLTMFCIYTVSVR